MSCDRSRAHCETPQLILHLRCLSGPIRLCHRGVSSVSGASRGTPSFVPFLFQDFVRCQINNASRFVSRFSGKFGKFWGVKERQNVGNVWQMYTVYRNVKFGQLWARINIFTTLFLIFNVLRQTKKVQWPPCEHFYRIHFIFGLFVIDLTNN